MPTTAERLTAIETRLTAIEASLASRSAPIDQALADIESSYGLVGQLVEVAHAQREQLEALIGRLDRLLDLLQTHDRRLQAHEVSSQKDREEIAGLMVQLRELARTQVRETEDLKRAVGGDDGNDQGRSP